MASQGSTSRNSHYSFPNSSISTSSSGEMLHHGHREAYYPPPPAQYAPYGYEQHHHPSSSTSSSTMLEYPHPAYDPYALPQQLPHHPAPPHPHYSHSQPQPHHVGPAFPEHSEPDLDPQAAFGQTSFSYAFLPPGATASLGGPYEGDPSQGQGYPPTGSTTTGYESHLPSVAPPLPPPPPPPPPPTTTASGLSSRRTTTSSTSSTRATKNGAADQAFQSAAAASGASGAGGEVSPVGQSEGLDVQGWSGPARGGREGVKAENAGAEEGGLEVGQEEGQTEIKHRRRTTRVQLETLEDTFVRNPKPTAVERKDLGEKLDMSPRAVQVWFQNRRAKLKNMAKKAAENGDPPPTLADTRTYSSGSANSTGPRSTSRASVVDQQQHQHQHQHQQGHFLPVGNGQPISRASFSGYLPSQAGGPMEYSDPFGGGGQLPPGSSVDPSSYYPSTAPPPPLRTYSNGLPMPQQISPSQESFDSGGWSSSHHPQPPPTTIKMSPSRSRVQEGMKRRQSMPTVHGQPPYGGGGPSSQGGPSYGYASPHEYGSYPPPPPSGFQAPQANGRLTVATNGGGGVGPDRTARRRGSTDYSALINNSLSGGALGRRGSAPLAPPLPHHSDSSSSSTTSANSPFSSEAIAGRTVYSGQPSRLGPAYNGRQPAVAAYHAGLQGRRASLPSAGALGLDGAAAGGPRPPSHLGRSNTTYSRESDILEDPHDGVDAAGNGFYAPTPLTVQTDYSHPHAYPSQHSYLDPSPHSASGEVGTLPDSSFSFGTVVGLGAGVELSPQNSEGGYSAGGGVDPSQGFYGQQTQGLSAVGMYGAGEEYKGPEGYFAEDGRRSSLPVDLLSHMSLANGYTATSSPSSIVSAGTGPSSSRPSPFNPYSSSSANTATSPAILSPSGLYTLEENASGQSTNQQPRRPRMMPRSSSNRSLNSPGAQFPTSTTPSSVPPVQQLEPSPFDEHDFTAGGGHTNTPPSLLFTRPSDAGPAGGLGLEEMHHHQGSFGFELAEEGAGGGEGGQAPDFSAFSFN